MEYIKTILLLLVLAQTSQADLAAKTFRAKVKAIAYGQTVKVKLVKLDGNSETQILKLCSEDIQGEAKKKLESLERAMSHDQPILLNSQSVFSNCLGQFKTAADKKHLLKSLSI